MAQPQWLTPAGNLGTIPEGVFYSTPLIAVDPLLTDTVYYQLIAGQLPVGLQINQSGLLSGIPQSAVTLQGVPSPVSQDVTKKFAVRAYTKAGATINRLADRTFELTVSGQDAPEFITPPGQIAQFYDGSLIPGIQIQYTDVDPTDSVTVKLISGKLPPGLSINSSGLISGYIAPLSPINAKSGYDESPYDQYSFDFSTQGINANYEFTLEVTDDKVGGSNIRTFSIYVWSRSLLQASTTEIEDSNTFITADGSPIRIPILLNPQGSIGITRNDNWFAYKFDAIDFDGDPTQYIISNSSPAPLNTTGLALDLNTGWLYGTIPDLGTTDITYTFNVRVYKKDNIDLISNPYTYSLNIVGLVDTEITWLTDSDLGSIDNGSTSTLYVKAINVAGTPLKYRLAGLQPGNAPVYNSLPQGMQLLESGELAGRVSFDTFALDGGTTTFDVSVDNLGNANKNSQTTFDMSHTFTVNAYSVDGKISVFKTFTITLIRKFNEPYENLYVRAMPPLRDREFVNSLLQNQDIFIPDLLYRPTDPNFGLSTSVVYNHAFGLTASTLDDYYSSLYKNHYWKKLTLGEIQVAQAINDNGDVIYEVVYSRVIDNLLNDQGQSVSKEVTLPYPINENDSTEINTVYPNSLINMRDQVIDTVGQVANILPRWMTSKQADGRVLGFTPAWVLAYVKPGSGNQIAYYIKTKFGERLNLIDFEVDRYELDRLLTKNWDPTFDSTVGAWVPTPAQTTFDVGTTIVDWINNNQQTVTWINNSNESVNWVNGFEDPLGTTFDQNSLQFIAPVDMYSNTTEYDKYLVFPRKTILG